MTGTDLNENELFQEMNALVRRYGALKCQQALNAAASIELGTAKEAVHPKIYDIIDLVVSDVTDWQYFEVYDDFINLDFRENSEPKKAWFILDVLELYHDSLVHYSPDERYIFDTLFLGASPEIVEAVLEATKVMKLIKSVVIDGGDRRDCTIPEKSMVQVKDLVVNGGSISFLTIANSRLGHEDAIQFAGMLQVNQLKSLKVLQSIECSYMSIAVL